jgi:hypothetical protein
MSLNTSTHFIKSYRSKRDEPVDIFDRGDITFSKSLFNLGEVLPVKSSIPLGIRGTGV